MTRLVAIDGPSAAGKSTLARQISERLGCPIIEGDDFYADIDDAERAELEAEEGYRHYFDWRRLRNEVLIPLSLGRPARYRPWDWSSGTGFGDEIKVKPGSVVIVEGIYMLRPQLLGYWDLMIWVDAPARLRHDRQLARNENSLEWIERWTAAEKWYIKNLEPRKIADLVIGSPS